MNGAATQPRVLSQRPGTFQVAQQIRAVDAALINLEDRVHGADKTRRWSNADAALVKVDGRVRELTFLDALVRRQILAEDLLLEELCTRDEAGVLRDRENRESYVGTGSSPRGPDQFGQRDDVQRSASRSARRSARMSAYTPSSCSMMSRGDLCSTSSCRTSLYLFNERS